MPLFKFFKALICEISHGPLTSSKANIFRFSSVAPSERRVVNIFKNSRKSVVTITSEFKKNVNGKSVVYDDIGSGVVWDTDGHIVTNFHVIQDVSFRSTKKTVLWVHVLTSEGVEEKYDAKMVGANQVDDLAVLKITVPKSILKPITVGESTIVEVGQKVFLIGASQAYRHTLSLGIISGLNHVSHFKDGPPMKGMIQIDASVNNGNSGGPLLDCKGHMIGIVTSGDDYGYGSCIPYSAVVKIVTQLIKFNNANCPGLNIKINPDFQSHKLGHWTGAVVTRVNYNCAGSFSRRNSDMLIEGDIIIAVGDKSVRNKGDLFEILGDYHTGDIIMLKVIRDGLEVRLSIGFDDY